MNIRTQDRNCQNHKTSEIKYFRNAQDRKLVPTQGNLLPGRGATFEYIEGNEACFRQKE